MSNASRWIPRLRPSGTGGSSVGSFDPVRFEELCQEDPSAAEEFLMADAGEIVEALQGSVRLLEARVAEITKHATKTRSGREVSELRDMRAKHDHVRRTLRRIQAAFLEARELEEELDDWESRRGEPGPVHADHPSVRAEIARSELRSRLAALTDVRPKEESVFEILSAKKSRGRRKKNDPSDLVELIRYATREAERWHDVPYPDQDAVEQLRNVRHLHALLKQLDREAGRRRDRTDLAIRVRGW